MRVIQVISEPTGGGAEAIVRELHRQLPDHGMESIALYLTNRHAVRLRENEFSLDLSAPRTPAALPALGRFLDQNTTANTIVHGHLTDALYGLAFPRVGPGLAKVYTEHNTHNRRRGMPWLRLLERRVYQRYARIVCISRGVRANLVDWLGEATIGDRVRLISNGARLLSPAPERSPREGIRLVSVGSLTHRKGFDVALKAVAHTKCPIAEYVIVGDGEERHRLEVRAATLGLSRTVRFVGWCKDVEPWLHRADVQLIPSRWEGFGLVAIEGLSTGLPIVASDVPGLNEILTGTRAARLTPAGDAAAMSRAIDGLQSDLQHGEGIRAEAFMRAKQYGADRMVGEYARMYRELADERYK